LSKEDFWGPVRNWPVKQNHSEVCVCVTKALLLQLAMQLSEWIKTFFVIIVGMCRIMTV